MQKHLFFLLLLFTSIAYSQQQEYHIKKYGDEQGLTKIVRYAYQDSKGYLWVGTQYGLFRYDGKTFQSFYSQVKDTTGLRNSCISRITENSDGTIWIGTNKGLHYFKDDSITYVPLQSLDYQANQEAVREIYIDEGDKLFMGSAEGLYYLSDEKKLLPTSQLFGEKALDTLHIFGVNKNRDGGMLISGENEVFQVSKNYDSIKHLPVSWDEKLKKFDFYFYKIVPYKEYYLVDSELGLLKGKIKQDSLHLSPFYQPNGELSPQYTIYESIIDDKGDIWLATFRNKVKKLSLKQDTIREYEIAIEPYVDMHQHAISITQDQQKNIWVSSANGLYELSTNQLPVRQVLVNDESACDLKTNIIAIKKDKKEGVWLASTNKLFHVSKQKLLHKICLDEFEISLPTNRRINRLFVDSQNRLWLSTKGGIFIANTDTNETGDIEWVNISIKNGLPHNFTYEVFEENKNTFWVGTYNGLVKLTFENADISNPQIKTFAYNTDHGNSLPNAWVMDLQSDNENNLWLGTYSGVGKINLSDSTVQFENYFSDFQDFNTLSNASVKEIFLDADNNIWIGTQVGLNLYDKKNNHFIRFGTEDGLPSNYIKDIQQDKEGFLWIGTSKGLAKALWNKTKEKLIIVSVYGARHGLTGSDVIRSSMLLDDETTFFGMQDGMGRLQMKNFDYEELPFQLAISSIKSSAKDGDGFYSVKDVENQSFSRAYNENSIQVDYAALDFTETQFNEYRHRLEPIQSDWVYTGNNSRMEFYNLPPNKYVLHLDGANHLGQWAKTPLQLTFTIKPPFWKTNWAIAGYILASLVALYLLVRATIKRQERKLEQELAIRTAKEEARNKLRQENTADFHDELGSKLTKISMFLTLAERAIEERQNPVEWLKKIRTNAKDISTTFRDLLWISDPNQDTLAQLFLRLKDFGTELFEETETDFKVLGFTDELEEIILDAQTKKQVIFVFKEAMTNTLKYAKASEVHLKIGLNKTDFDLTFQDNGAGFIPNEIHNGRGLNNMKHRADKINSEFFIESAENGTIIMLKKIPHMGDGKPEKKS